MTKLYIMLAIGVLAGCTEPYEHTYSVGECVQMKITGEEGMVVWQYRNSNYLNVRVAQASKTNSAVFGANNTENQRYAVVSFREFELEDCQ